MSAKWTFMVYVAGYNNLSTFAGLDLAEMRNVGSSDDLKIAVFVKRLEQQAAHRIIVGKGGADEERQNLGGKIDSGSPQTMFDFIKWAVAKAPAERYALIIWNHGSGLGSARLRRDLHAGQGRRGDAARTRHAGLLGARPQPVHAHARDCADAADRRCARDRVG